MPVLSTIELLRQKLTNLLPTIPQPTRPTYTVKYTTPVQHDENPDDPLWERGRSWYTDLYIKKLQTHLINNRIRYITKIDAEIVRDDICFTITYQQPRKITSAQIDYLLQEIKSTANIKKRVLADLKPHKKEEI